MITHAGAGGSAGNGEGRAEADAITVFEGRPVTEMPGTAVQPADRERFRLSFLPGQLLTFDEVERGVNDMKRLAWAQIGHEKVIVGIKAGKEVRPAGFLLA